jgi:hypothetical protein
MKEVFEMPSAQGVIMRSGEYSGVMSFIAKGDFISNVSLSPPPHMGEHTNEIVNSI